MKTFTKTFIWLIAIIAILYGVAYVAPKISFYEQEIEETTLTPDEENEMVQNVLNRFNLFIIKESENTNGRINEIFNTVGTNPTILHVPDDTYIETLIEYNNLKEGDYNVNDDGTPSFNLIEGKNEGIEKTLLWREYSNSIFNGYTRASRIIEIANKDKDVKYVATLNGTTKISLEDISDDMHLVGVIADTDENGVVTCICRFEPDFK